MSLTFTPGPGNQFLEIAAHTQAVTAGFLNEIIAEIADFVDQSERRHVKLLLIVTAPRIDMTITETYQAWHRASRSSVGHAQIAYVIDGRPMNPLAQFVEAIAENRRMQLRFFVHRDAALEWLAVSTPANGRVA